MGTWLGNDATPGSLITMLSRTIQVTLLAEIARYPYFLLLASFLCASAISVLGESPTVFDWLDVPMAITALVGVFGFVFRMRIFRPGFWQAFMLALLAWEITYNLVLAWQMDLALRPLGEDLWAYLVVGLAFLAPMYVVLFLYAYRSQSIWAGQAGPKLPRFPLCDTDATRWMALVQFTLLILFGPALALLGSSLGLSFAQIMIYAFVGGLLVLGPLEILIWALIAKLRPQDFAFHCPACAFTRYGLWWPGSLRQLLSGGRTCRGCGSVLDRRGNLRT